MAWPVWFTGLQIPPELKRTRKPVRDYAADAADEADKEDLTHPKAKRSLPTKNKKVKKQKRENKDELSDNYDEDEETVTEDVGCTSDESDEEVEINERIFTGEESYWEVPDFYVAILLKNGLNKLSCKLHFHGKKFSRKTFFPGSPSFAEKNSREHSSVKVTCLIVIIPQYHSCLRGVGKIQLSGKYYDSKYFSAIENTSYRIVFLYFFQEK